MSIQSWLRAGAGAVVALALPIATWVLGLSLEGVAFTAEQVRLRDIAIEQARPLADLLITFGPAELLLGPLGAFVIGRAAGTHGATRWLVLVAAIVPLLAFWALGWLTLGAALGSGL